jgi:hypothetical protein
MSSTAVTPVVVDASSRETCSATLPSALARGRCFGSCPVHIGVRTDGVLPSSLRALRLESNAAVTPTGRFVVFRFDGEEAIGRPPAA